MSNIQNRLNKVLREINSPKIARYAYDRFKYYTPIDTGNAKRKTKLQGFTIIADYPYATRLEQGWSSQAYDGMTKPTLQDVRDYINMRMGVTL